MNPKDDNLSPVAETEDVEGHGVSSGWGVVSGRGFTSGRGIGANRGAISGRGVQSGRLASDAEDDDVEGHAGRFNGRRLQGADEDVEGHRGLKGPLAPEEDVEGHRIRMPIEADDEGTSRGTGSTADDVEGPRAQLRR